MVMGPTVAYRTCKACKEECNCAYIYPSSFWWEKGEGKVSPTYIGFKIADIFLLPETIAHRADTMTLYSLCLWFLASLVVGCYI